MSGAVREMGRVNIGAHQPSSHLGSHATGCSHTGRHSLSVVQPAKANQLITSYVCLPLNAPARSPSRVTCQCVAPPPFGSAPQLPPPARGGRATQDIAWAQLQLRALYALPPGCTLTCAASEQAQCAVRWHHCALPLMSFSPHLPCWQLLGVEHPWRHLAAVL